MKLLLLAITFISAQDPKLPLKWKFEKGQTLRWELIQRTTLESDTLSFDHDICLTLKQVVTAVSAKGEATLETTFEGIRFKVIGLPMDSEYDSAKDKELPEDDFGHALATLPGASFTMNLDSTGTLTAVTGFEKIASKMVESMEEGENDQIKNWIKELYGDTVQRMMLQQAFVQFPPDPIAPGATWKNDLNTELPLLGAVKFNIGSTFKAVRKGGDGGEAEIEQEVTVAGNSDSTSVVEIAGGKGTRSVVFHIERGAPTQSAMEVKINLKMGDSDLPLKLVTKMKPLPCDVPSKKSGKGK